MCLAVPLELKEINGLDGVCGRDGITREVRLDFIKEPKIGDYVLVHAGYAIEKVDKDQAKEDIDAYREVEEEIRKLYEH